MDLTLRDRIRNVAIGEQMCVGTSIINIINYYVRKQKAYDETVTCKGCRRKDEQKNVKVDTSRTMKKRKAKKILGR